MLKRFLPLVLFVLQLALPSALAAAGVRGAHAERRAAVRAVFVHHTRALLKRTPSTWQFRHLYPLQPAGSPQAAPVAFTSTALRSPSFGTSLTGFGLLPQERAPPTLD